MTLEVGPPPIFGPPMEAGDDNRNDDGAGFVASASPTAASDATANVQPELVEGQWVAKKLFRVGMGAGNNYRVIAAVHDALGSPAWLPDAKTIAEDGGTLGMDETHKKTDMLTVWRRLHIELDSLGAPTGETFTDSDATLDGDYNPGDIGSPGTGAADDLFEFWNASVTDLARTELEKAYITLTVIAEGTGSKDTRDDATFVRNVDIDSDAATTGEYTVASSVRDIPSTPGFWVVHVVGMYEANHALSNDTPPGGAALGHTKQESVGVNYQEGSVAIFLETIRDVVVAIGGDLDKAKELVRRNVYHEILHRFGAIDTKYTSATRRKVDKDGSGIDITDGGIMDYATMELEPVSQPLAVSGSVG